MLEFERRPEKKLGLGESDQLEALWQEGLSPPVPTPRGHGPLWVKSFLYFQVRCHFLSVQLRPGTGENKEASNRVMTEHSLSIHRAVFWAKCEPLFVATFLPENEQLRGCFLWAMESIHLGILSRKQSGKAFHVREWGSLFQTFFSNC